MRSIETIILNLLEPNLGASKINFSQIRFNCPHCDAGNKFNLEISLKTKVFHCWSCGYKGYITKLLRDFAINDSWKEVKEFKSVDFDKFKRGLYQKRNIEIYLPPKTIPFYLNKNVESYLLNERKMNKEWLINRKCMYVFEESNDEEETSFKNNIIFPFYDEYDNLNGYCCHNYITKKYKNIGVKNYVPYENFINIHLPITLTEGVYDCGSIPNAIPLLNTDITKEVLEFCTQKDIILALDKEVKEYLIDKHIKSLQEYAVRNVYVFKNPYKDLNEFLQRDEKGLKLKFYNIYEKFKINNQ